MVGFSFLPQNFGSMVGTYECHLPFCECRYVDGLVVLLGGGGDTQHPHVVIKLV